MKRLITYVLAAAMALSLAACGAPAADNTDNADSTPAAADENIRSLSFFKNDDIKLKVGQSNSSSYIQVKVKDRSEFSPDDVLFISENEEIASFSFSRDALTTYLYYDVTGIAEGETYIYASSLDGSVTSEKVKVIVTGSKTDRTATNISDEPSEPEPEEAKAAEVSTEETSPVEVIPLETMAAEQSGEPSDRSVPADPEPEPAAMVYVLNTSTRKFHLPGCSSVSTIKDSNRRDYEGTREEVIAMGYEPCGRCHP